MIANRSELLRHISYSVKENDLRFASKIPIASKETQRNHSSFCPSGQGNSIKAWNLPFLCDFAEIQNMVMKI